MDVVFFLQLTKTKKPTHKQVNYKSPEPKNAQNLQKSCFIQHTK